MAKKAFLSDDWVPVKTLPSKDGQTNCPQGRHGQFSHWNSLQTLGICLSPVPVPGVQRCDVPSGFCVGAGI